MDGAHSQLGTAVRRKNRANTRENSSFTSDRMSPGTEITASSFATSKAAGSTSTPTIRRFPQNTEL